MDDRLHQIEAALREVVEQFNLWSEDANDGEFAYYRSDGLMTACVNARAILAENASRGSANTFTSSTRPKAAERSVMTDAAKSALDVLVSIAEDEDIEADTRIRAACSILKDDIDQQVREEARASA